MNRQGSYHLTGRGAACGSGCFLQITGIDVDLTGGCTFDTWRRRVDLAIACAAGEIRLSHKAAPSTQRTEALLERDRFFTVRFAT